MLLSLLSIHPLLKSALGLELSSHKSEIANMAFKQNSDQVCIEISIPYSKRHRTESEPVQYLASIEECG